MLLTAVALPAPAGAEEGDAWDDTPDTPGATGTITLAPGGEAFGGTYVSGEFPADGAILANFTLAGQRLFDEVRVPGYARDEVEVHGGYAEADGTFAEVEVSDSLAGYLKLKLETDSSAFVFPAQGVSFAEGPEGSVTLSAPGTRGLLWAHCAPAVLTVASGTLRLGPVGGGCELHFRASTAFDVLPAGELDDALAAGELAAEVSLGGPANGSAVSLVTFSSVEVNVTADASGVFVAVAGSSSSGRSVVVFLPRALLDAGDAVEARYDGREVAASASSEDALSALDDGGAPEFHLTSKGNLTALVVSVPSFSVHLFELRFVGGAPALAGVPLGEAALPLALGAVVAVGAGAALLRRPEE